MACDEGFGRDTALLDGIAGVGLWYYAEVPHDTRVWVARPAMAVPVWSGRGRKPTREQLAADAPAAEEVARLAEALPATAWSRQLIKEGSNGPIAADCAARRVAAARDGRPGPDVWLILRRNPETGELKTYLSNAPADTPLATLVRLSGMRWPIERCFEEGKQHLGLGDYEVRSWRGWHHHTTLVILAHFFLVRLQRRWGGGKAPALTLPQVQLLVAVVLPKRTFAPCWALEVLAYWQHRNAVAYRAQRKRRLARLRGHHELSL